MCIINCDTLYTIVRFFIWNPTPALESSQPGARRWMKKPLEDSSHLSFPKWSKDKASHHALPKFLTCKFMNVRKMIVLFFLIVLFLKNHKVKLFSGCFFFFFFLNVFLSIWKFSENWSFRRRKGVFLHPPTLNLPDWTFRCSDAWWSLFHQEQKLVQPHRVMPTSLGHSLYCREKDDLLEGILSGRTSCL